MFYFFKLAAIGIVTVPAALATTLFGLFDPYGKRVYGISRFWAWAILRIGGASVKIHGLHHLSLNQPYIFMVNHQSNIDIPVLLHGLPAFQLRWIAKKELLWVPFFGWAMWAAKHIAVDRSDRSDALAVLAKARRQIDQGISIVVFPEGTRSSDGRLLPFKRGGFLLAVKTKMPIVPVTINGSGRILPKGDWRIRRGAIEVAVGEPISMENYRPGTIRQLAAEVYGRVAQQLWSTPQTATVQAGPGGPAVAARAPIENRTL
jgi:1-acyl-sn-glycerol-3-phosphate acyltransferase